VTEKSGREATRGSLLKFMLHKSPTDIGTCDVVGGILGEGEAGDKRHLKQPRKIMFCRFFSLALSRKHFPCFIVLSPASSPVVVGLWSFSKILERGNLHSTRCGRCRLMNSIILVERTTMQSKQINISTRAEGANI
jgi:hypothetical protein